MIISLGPRLPNGLGQPSHEATAGTVRRGRGRSGTRADFLLPKSSLHRQEFTDCVHTCAAHNPRYSEAFHSPCGARLCGTGPTAPFRYVAQRRVLPAWRSIGARTFLPMRYGTGRSSQRAGKNSMPLRCLSFKEFVGFAWLRHLSSVGQSDRLVSGRSRVRFPEVAPLVFVLLSSFLNLPLI